MTTYTTTSPSDVNYPSRYYVKTFDVDGEFVREIRVFGSSEADALASAARELCSDECSMARPLIHHPIH